MEEQKNSKVSLILTIILLLATVAACLTAAWAYSKYTKEYSGIGKANVAKWNVTIDSNEAKEIVSHQQHVYNGKIAPGTSGSFVVAINTNDTQVDVKYSIIIDEMQTNPAGYNIKHLKFFTDEAHKNEIKIGEANSNLVGIIKSEKTNTEQTASNQATKVIYWYWPFDYKEASSEENKAAYGNIIEEYKSQASSTVEADKIDSYAEELYDEEDSSVSANIESMTIDYTIKAWQIEPEDAENLTI